MEARCAIGRARGEAAEVEAGIARLGVGDSAVALRETGVLSKDAEVELRETRRGLLGDAGCSSRRGDGDGEREG